MERQQQDLRGTTVAEFVAANRRIVAELHAMTRAWLATDPGQRMTAAESLSLADSLEQLAHAARKNAERLVEAECCGSSVTQVVDSPLLTVGDAADCCGAAASNAPHPRPLSPGAAKNTGGEGCQDIKPGSLPLERLEIRWMIRRDMAEVLAIEQANVGPPWDEQDFLNALRQRNSIGMVAELNQRVVGFMIYELSRPQIEVLNFAVHPEFRRLGIGERMVAKLHGKLHTTAPAKRKRLVFHVRESNLGGQQFLAACGLRAELVRGHYKREDGYRFECGPA